MKRRVTGKQQNSKMCFVCGLKNPSGLRAAFYQLEGGELLAVFEPREEHQSYPGRLHGGIAAAILDETIGRAIMFRSKGEAWGVTVELTVRMKKPLPLHEPLKVIGRIGKEGSRIFEGSGEILLPDGSVAVEAQGRYIRMPLERIADFDREDQEWRVVPSPNDPEEVEVGAEPGKEPLF
jgi:acyl-coenzyme A thioesterase PaaI-like protein